ncbi:MAG TPA: sugar ABC transporter permease [Firmicutes bacterium]|nr:sugar ABC transporter permease [Bacillota bacterium]
MASTHHNVSAELAIQPGRFVPDPRDLRQPLSVRVRPYLIIGPALLLTVGILYPFGLAVYYSLTNYTLSNPNYSFVGFLNYKMLLTDPEFYHSAKVTLAYAFSATAVETILGLGVALLLNRETPLARVLRTVMIFPLMIAPVIGTLIWKLMMQPSVGILNYLLGFIGLSHFEWAAAPQTALFSVVLVDVWIYTPFISLLLLAGLQSMPKEPFESARVDGGSAWFTFKNLTLPMLAPFLIIAVIFRLIDSLKMFDVIYAMTGGGPGQTLMNFPLQAYYYGILYMNLSYGLTYMIILWAIVYLISQILVVYWGKAQQRAAGL